MFIYKMQVDAQQRLLNGFAADWKEETRQTEFVFTGRTMIRITFMDSDGLNIKMPNHKCPTVYMFFFSFLVFFNLMKGKSKR